jgi:hypothetical protein
MPLPDDPHLPPGQQLAAPGRWPAIGELHPGPGGDWNVAISGEVNRPCQFSLTQLRAMPQTRRIIDIHCVTRWSKLGVIFSGIPLEALLEIAGPTAEARYVSFVARSARGHSTSLSLDDVRDLGALVALSADGAALKEVHGGPIRVVVPGRYFYKSLKWLERIELLASDRLGYWEGVAGYHNTANPWLEQRYMAPGLSRQEMQTALASRDFTRRDLRSLDARDHDLPGLIACDCILRDADFRGARLVSARFDRANLSNAHFAGADLREASFASADVEGADFSGADLRGADFTGASLVGVTFFEDQAGERFAAIIDRSTRIEPAGIEQLAPPQAAFVHECTRETPTAREE